MVEAIAVVCFHFLKPRVMTSRQCAATRIQAAARAHLPSVSFKSARADHWVSARRLLRAARELAAAGDAIRCLRCL
jgi:hypothetical protein